MGSADKERIEALIRMLRDLADVASGFSISEAIQEIDDLLLDLQSKYEGIPENLQQTARNQATAEAIEVLEDISREAENIDIANKLEEWIDSLSSLD